MFTRLAFDSFHPEDGDEVARFEVAHGLVRSSATRAATNRADAGVHALGGGSHHTGGSREFDAVIEQSLQRVSLPDGLLARLHASVDGWDDCDE